MAVALSMVSQIWEAKANIMITIYLLEERESRKIGAVLEKG